MIDKTSPPDLLAIEAPGSPPVNPLRGRALRALDWRGARRWFCK